MNREDIIRMARQAGSLIEAAQEKDLLWLERFAALVTSAAIKEILAQPDYKSTYDYQLMENAQGELERIKLVQTGVGIEQRAEEAYEAAKQRSWVGVSDEVAQPEQDWIERERAVGYREGHMAALAQRKWVGLTDKEIDELWMSHHDDFGNSLSATGYERAIETKLKEKNT